MTLPDSVKEMTSIERWLAYFSNKLNEKEMEELAMKETAIHTAMDVASTFMQDENERLAYRNREMDIMDYESDKEAWTAEGEQNIIRKMNKKGYTDVAINEATDWPIDTIKKERNLLSM